MLFRLIEYRDTKSADTRMPEGPTVLVLASHMPALTYIAVQSGSYGTTERPEIHHLLPQGIGRHLDVGCNDGGFAAWLISTVSEVEVWGVEPNAQQARLASQHCEGVVEAYYPDALAEAPGKFDCMTFNHVLEHIVDPWEALRATIPHLSQDACVIAVIPNVRYISVLWNLAIRGRWCYVESGILDRTHLRFFTRETIVDLFESSGFEVDVIEPVNHIGSVRFPRLSRIVSLVARDLSCGGFAVRARPAGQPSVSRSSS